MTTGHLADGRNASARIEARSGDMTMIADGPEGSYRYDGTSGESVIDIAMAPDLLSYSMQQQSQILSG